MEEKKVKKTTTATTTAKPKEVVNDHVDFDNDDPFGATESSKKKSNIVRKFLFTNTRYSLLVEKWKKVYH
jgi:hypothetical protein